MFRFTIDKTSRVPFYTQLVTQAESAVKEGLLKEGDILPSMNALAVQLGISKETIKKAYSILRDLSIVEPRQGKGFYVRGQKDGRIQNVLIISDVHSIYKQLLLNSFQSILSGHGGFETAVLLHNQDVRLLRFFLDRYLGLYDWYVVVPHFPLDAKTQKEVLQQIGRIPNRKLILLDHIPSGLQGNFGAVYQDFGNDAYEALSGAIQDFKDKRRINAVTLPSSLYKEYISEGIRRFASENGLPLKFNDGRPESILPGDVCIILSSQHDFGLVDLSHRTDKAGLKIGKDVFIICYNDFPLNELVLGGLTTMSTDFEKMGRTAAEMILSGRLSKIHSPFRLIRRSTF